MHGEDAARTAEGAARVLFGGDPTLATAADLDAVADEVPAVDLDLAGDPHSATVSALLQASGVVKTSSEARRAIDQGGVSLNGERLAGDRQVTAADLLHGRHVLLRKGKRTFAMVRALP